MPSSLLPYLSSHFHLGSELHDFIKQCLTFLQSAVHKRLITEHTTNCLWADILWVSASCPDHTPFTALSWFTWPREEECSQKTHKATVADAGSLCFNLNWHHRWWNHSVSSVCPGFTVEKGQSWSETLEGGIYFCQPSLND